MKYIRGGYFHTKLQKRQSPARWRGFMRFDETGAILSKQARVGKSQLQFNRAAILSRICSPFCTCSRLPLACAAMAVRTIDTKS